MRQAQNVPVPGKTGRTENFMLSEHHNNMPREDFSARKVSYLKESIFLVFRIYVLSPVHSLHVLQQAFLVVDDQHVTKVAPHCVGFLLDLGLGLGGRLLLVCPCPRAHLGL